MSLSIENKNMLLVSLHQLIEESANLMANHIFHARLDQLINYPPNGGLTEAEADAVNKLKGEENLRTALRKILAGNAADVLFNLLNIIDGTADPENGDWSGVTLVDTNEEDEDKTEMLHDDFYATYWDWRKLRKNKNWKLDLLED